MNFIIKYIEKFIEADGWMENGVVSVAPRGHASKIEFAMKILDVIKNVYNINSFDNVVLEPVKTPEQFFYPHISSLDILDPHHLAVDEKSWEEDLVEYMTAFKETYSKEVLTPCDSSPSLK